MIPAQRQQQIISLVKDSGHVQVSELAKTFGVSELTIRRDLKILSDSGLLTRSFGGAVLSQNFLQEIDYSEKINEFMEEKRAIGKKAASFVKDGDIICVNGGSTTVCVVESLLKTNKQITIITNNVDIIRFLGKEEKANIIFTGGIFRAKSRSMNGFMSSLSLQNIWANKSFIGLDGFSIKHGLTVTVYEEALITKTMIERTTGKVFAVTAGNKINVVCNFKAVGADRIDAVITDGTGGQLLENEPEAPEIIIAE
ncbi:DeoR/GlpR transcriptional regulator [Treponema parvum]|uniref:DeoR/GlpR transcriptional regulator n=1 Tax=Treponema parvum TaxID=138851 RepID=A0A975ICU9_9SPIR|nr:DeoR/GlpR family DNA-binding transcription regulator [Treponema parvum]QTQ12376.1 DeoR/GlpR transcriptional regulator [Treponema parvum]QTQ15632.1 DeoR/GlpR transcriptional regulator [Treponema parvum]